MGVWVDAKKELPPRDSEYEDISIIVYVRLSKNVCRYAYYDFVNEEWILAKSDRATTRTVLEWTIDEGGNKNDCH
jgi:hypothetical protein